MCLPLSGSCPKDICLNCQAWSSFYQRAHCLAGSSCDELPPYLRIVVLIGADVGEGGGANWRRRRLPPLAICFGGQAGKKQGWCGPEQLRPQHSPRTEMRSEASSFELRAASVRLWY